jgi:hypothetical protein
VYHLKFILNSFELTYFLTYAKNIMQINIFLNIINKKIIYYYKLFKIVYEKIAYNNNFLLVITYNLHNIFLQYKSYFLYINNFHK